ncbi:hypothetical protein M5K25_005283 [Dendrobium thyrsiflorum]|uniref:Reverse transcriptase zinc-binding domain-containing protein n=1 Tax=Dendrobium thyrsiflorum TaxID=117978 RepID=A0ABD0VH30_DENTH
MDPSAFSSAFPPLVSSSSPSLPKPPSWDRILTGSPNPSEFSISTLQTPEEIIPFQQDDIAEANDEWSLALVGYSLGRRPFYETLLKAIRKSWILKGTLKLISLSEGFFLFKFSTLEDYEMVWARGAWFILGKPFIFQKWTPHFSPKREEFNTVPIWFKIHDLPLCCWTPVGISKIATKIGIPMAVDALTASKSRLTYARVCVQVDSTATYPEQIPISVTGKLFNLKIEYEWKPELCGLCKSFNHSTSSCPTNPNPPPQTAPTTVRGRSTSRRHRSRPTSLSSKSILPQPISNANTVNSKNQMQSNQTAPQTILGHDLVTLPNNAIPKPLPNLNSPTTEHCASGNDNSTEEPYCPLNNKFSTLAEHQEPQGSDAQGHPERPKQLPKTFMTHPTIASWNIRGFNSPEKVICCKNLVSEEKIDIICLLENRISLSNIQDRWFCSNHRIFANENSINNFDQASPGRIWIKWNSDNISFTHTSSSSQMITGIVKTSHTIPFLLSAVYASNSFEERLALWEDLSKIQSNNTLPWVILGDFNCCRFQSDKKGGNSIPLSRLAPFNNFIFDSHLVELPSTGLFHTWYNQRTDNPIHLRLDRILVNVDWLSTFPNSDYKVVNSLISDHTPLILKSDVPVGSKPRFMFKNFWCRIPEFWSILLSIFDAPSSGNPITSLFLKLKLLKSRIKAKRWDSSNHIADMCRNLTCLQRECQAKLDLDPLNGNLCADFKKLSSDLAFYQSTWASWTIQRAKVKWLQKGEEDLKFLYSKIRKRQSFNSKALKGVSFGEDNSHTDNMLGRTQYIKYTITNTIAYWIRGSCIPKSIIKIISKLSAKFLHLGGSQLRKLHLIPWMKFCKPKAKGGLGIVSFQALIHAFNCGVIFRWYNSQSPLINWLNTRYHSPWKTTQSNASPFWKSLSITACNVRHSFSFHIHHNCRAYIQWDHWCKGATLASWLPNLILGGEQNSRLCDWINPLGWNIPPSVPAALSAFIRAIPISQLDGVNILWKNSNKAVFRDFYQEFFANDADFILHDLIWHKNHSLRFSAYSWLACMGGLKTAVEMIKRNIHITDSSCNFCYVHVETSAHLLFECDYSFMVLSSIIPSFANFFLRPNLGQALQHIGNLDIQKDIKNGMLLALNASVYHLWIERNRRRFNNDATSSCTLIRKIKRALSFRISNWKNGDLIKGCLDIRHTGTYLGSGR